jgi:NADH:ubiquinone oxidoreductase subunit D
MGFEEREKLMNFIERVSGARLTRIIHSPGEGSSDLTVDLLIGYL